MARLIVLMSLTIVAVVFAMSNTQDVQLSLVFGEPVEIRLIVLLVIAYAGGVVSSFFYQTITQLNRRAERRRLRASARQTALAKTEDG